MVVPYLEVLKACCFEQPDLVGGFPAQGRGIGQDGPFQPKPLNDSIICIAFPLDSM